MTFRFARAYPRKAIIYTTAILFLGLAIVTPLHVLPFYLSERQQVIGMLLVMIPELTLLSLRGRVIVTRDDLQIGRRITPAGQIQAISISPNNSGVGHVIKIQQVNGKSTSFLVGLENAKTFRDAIEPWSHTFGVQITTSWI